MAAGILDGYRVLDFGRYIAAPYCCQLLADMGAEVIRVERPGGEADRQRAPLDANGQSLYFVTLNRNKQAVTLNLDCERGRSLLRELAGHVDVLVHNQPAPRAERLGLGYQALREGNPRLIYLAISGFGSRGPSAERVAFDAIIQALSGAMSMSGLPGNPPMLSHIPWVDFGTALYGALAVVSALLHRERTGQGQQVDLALYGTALSFVGAYGVLAEYARNGVVRRAVGNDMIYAAGGCFPAADGHVVVNALTEPMWRNLCKAIGRQELLDDSRLRSDQARYEHRGLVDEAIGGWMATRTTAEIVRVLGGAGIAVAPAQTVAALRDDPQALALDMWRDVEQPGLGAVPVANLPMKFSETPGQVQRAAPAVGADNTAVYGGLLGFGDDALSALVHEGVI